MFPLVFFVSIIYCLHKFEGKTGAFKAALFFSFLSIAFVNLISLPYETSAKYGELFYAYILKAQLTDIEIVKEFALDTIPIFFIKFFGNLVHSFSLLTKTDSFLVVSILFRIVISIISASMVFIIFQRFFLESKNKFFYSILAMLLFGLSFYTWHYLNGDQLRNATGGLFFLALIYSYFDKQNLKSLRIPLAFCFGFLSFISHKVFLFLVPIFFFSFYFVNFFKFLYWKLSKNSFDLHHYRGKLIYFLITIFLVILCMHFAYMLVKETVFWSSEAVFSGATFDISGFFNKTYIEKLLLPASIFNISIFLLNTFAFFLSRKELDKVVPFFYNLFTINLVFFILGSLWMIGIDIDLSRVHLIYWPLTSIQILISFFIIFKAFSVNESLMRKLSLYATALILFVLFFKIIYQSSFDQQLSQPLHYGFFANSLEELSSYLFDKVSYIVYVSILLLFIIVISIYAIYSILNEGRFLARVGILILLLVTPWASSTFNIHYKIYSGIFKDRQSIEYLSGKELYKLSKETNPNVISLILDRDLLKMSADKGYAKANTLLGLRYSSIWGYEEDHIKNDTLAITYLEKGRELGDIDAYYFLSKYYKKSEQTDKFIDALTYAANHGISHANFELAIFYEGIHLYDLAQKWYCRAYEDSSSIELKTGKRVDYHSISEEKCNINLKSIYAN